VTEDQFLGALLGLAIGDALGVPLRGLTAQDVARHYGEIRDYAGIPVDGEGQSPAGEISIVTETILCLVESLTTNDGFLDGENINARLQFLLRGPSGSQMSAVTVKGIEGAEARGGFVEPAGDDPEELAVGARSVPVGLMNAIGVFDAGTLESEAIAVTRLSHRGEVATRPAIALGYMMVTAARQPGAFLPWFERVQPGPYDEITGDIHAIGSVIAASSTFEQGVFDIVAQGGEANTRGAIAGAIAGVRFGASGIPQHLIDDLDARIYLTLAAPWFYRTALRRNGTIIDLRVDR
jgi:ADP-ribosyl-[dinitrogen reductase] hydrolase